jgi:hypothetical protein
MEDMGIPPFESNVVELWVSRQLAHEVQPSQIADELVRQWEKSSLTLSAQYSVTRFCLLNGFYAPIIRMLRKFLSSGALLPWASIVEIIMIEHKNIPKELVDALFVGATRDKQLHMTAAQALHNGESDPRWHKIFESELKDLKIQAQKKRDALLEEALIYKREGMHGESRDALAKLLLLFPEDFEARQLAEQSQERSLDETLANIRRQHDRRSKPRTLREDTSDWPELSVRLAKVKKRLSLQSAYELSIGLHQMSLHTDALDILRTHKKKWSDRERSFEMELLLAQGSFAEALENAQGILKEEVSDAELLFTALYISAKAFRGLEDLEQATSILKGLLKHRPDYRDAALLLREWET